MPHEPVAPRTKNRLLAALPAAAYEALRPALEPVELRLRETLYAAGRPVEHVSFPERGRVRVLDRGRLEAASCECYGIIRREYERLVGGCG